MPKVFLTFSAANQPQCYLKQRKDVIYTECKKHGQSASGKRAGEMSFPERQLGGVFFTRGKEQASSLLLASELHSAGLCGLRKHFYLLKLSTLIASSELERGEGLRGPVHPRGAVKTPCAPPWERHLNLL